MTSLSSPVTAYKSKDDRHEDIHIINRGNAGDNIFINERDREKFLEYKVNVSEVARDVAIYLSRDLTGKSGVNLGKYFGNISGAGIRVRYNLLAKQIQRNRRLKGRITRIKNRIINN